MFPASFGYFYDANISFFARFTEQPLQVCTCREVLALGTLFCLCLPDIQGAQLFAFQKGSAHVFEAFDGLNGSRQILCVGIS